MKYGVILLGVPLVLVLGLPLLPFAAVSGKGTKSESSLQTKEQLLAIVLAFVTFCGAWVSGKSLLGVVLSGRFCAKAFYGAVGCTSYSDQPLKFVTFTLLYWVLFWVSLTFFAGTVRLLIAKARQAA